MTTWASVVTEKNVKCLARPTRTCLPGSEDATGAAKRFVVLTDQERGRFDSLALRSRAGPDGARIILACAARQCNRSGGSGEANRL